MKRILILFLLASSLHAASEATLRSLVDSTYTFYPRDFKSKADYEAKTKELDAVWSEFRASGQTGLAVLREELKADGKNRYFYFDGASLLITMSHQPDDLALAIRAIGKAEFKQLDWRGYFDVVRSIGAKGGDVTPLALRILEEPEYRIFVPQHALTIDPDFAMIFMIKDVPGSVAGPELIRAFEATPDPTRKKYILTALWYTLDPAALAYINTLHPTDYDGPVRERVVEFQRRNTLVGHGGLFSKSYATLNAERRATLDRVSDEAMDEYEDLTRKTVAAIKRLPKYP